MSLSLLWAQSETINAVQEINKIKRSADHIYAESTTASWEEALDNAKTLLLSQIEVWVKQEHPDAEAAGYIAKANNKIFEIKATRGQMYRAFVYVRKDDLMPYSDSEQVMVVPVNKEASISVALIDTLQKKQDNMQEVKSREDSAEKTPVEATSAAQDKQVPAVVETPAYVPSETEKHILAVTKASQINDFIRNLQSSNKIRGFGKYAEMQSDSDCYLFVYDKEGNIPAHLHKTGTSYFNIGTGKNDDIANYKGCGAFWFIYR